MQTQKAELSQQFIIAQNTSNESELESVKSLLKSTEVELSELRAEGRRIMNESNLEIESNDRDYVFLSFILKYLPKGLVGLLLAVILSAAMSSTAAEINALGTTTVIDLYTRNLAKPLTEKKLLQVSKLFTLAWGIIAIFVATSASLFDNLIQLVNYIGSIFYGTILGIFLVAFYFKKIGAHAVFIGAIIAQIIVLIFTQFSDSYLWFNVVGCLSVVLFASLIQIFTKQDVKTS